MADPIYKQIRVLHHKGDHGTRCWITETRAQVNAALRQLFKLLDNDDCYRNIEPDLKELLPAARVGDHGAIYRILKARQGYEYEGWRVEHATDATEP